MNTRNTTIQPDNTAVRTALWRALHKLSDPPPYIIDDDIGLQLADPDPGWQNRPDMDLNFTRRVRLSMASRARFVEDLVIEKNKAGVSQYVILGAGLDTFAQRRPKIADQLQIFEIDRPDQQIWKRQRLIDLGFGVPDSLHFVPVDFEIESDWQQKLERSGFDPNQPAVIACAGLSMYLTREANLATLRQLVILGTGSTVTMTFLIPKEMLEEADLQLMEISMQGAQRSGNPFKSFFTHAEMLDLANEAGFKDARIVSKKDIVQRYFSDRNDNLDPASGEDILVAG